MPRQAELYLSPLTGFEGCVFHSLDKQLESMCFRCTLEAHRFTLLSQVSLPTALGLLHLNCNLFKKILSPAMCLESSTRGVWFLLGMLLEQQQQTTTWLAKHCYIVTWICPAWILHILVPGHLYYMTAPLISKEMHLNFWNKTCVGKQYCLVHFCWKSHKHRTTVWQSTALHPSFA